VLDRASCSIAESAAPGTCLITSSERVASERYTTTDGLNRGHYCRRCAARCTAENRDAPVYANDLSGRSAGGVEGTSCILHGHQIATGPDTSSVQRDRIEFFGGIYFRGGRDRRGASVSRLLQVGWAR